MLRQFPIALKMYDRLLDIVPNDLDTVGAKAAVYQAQGNLDQAAKLPEVLLWTLELQVHWTVSPGWIVIDEGGKKRPPLPTVTVKVVAVARDGPSTKSGPMPSIAAVL